MAPPLQVGEVAPPLQEEQEETVLALQEEAALALQQDETASSLQAEEVAPPSTTDSLDSWGEVVGGSSPAEPPTTPVLVEPPSNTQPATPVSQADEHEGGNDRGQEDEAGGGNDQGCEQQREKTSNRAIERADDRATESASNQSVRVDDQASVAAAADGSSTANQRACVQQGIEDYDDQTSSVRDQTTPPLLRELLRIIQQR